MEKKKIKKLIKEVKENKNPALMLNRVLDVEEINWLYEQAEYYKEKANTREKIYYKIDLLNDNLYAWVGILSTTTIISIIGVLVLFFK